MNTENSEKHLLLLLFGELWPVAICGLRNQSLILNFGGMEGGVDYC